MRRGCSSVAMTSGLQALIVSMLLLAALASPTAAQTTDAAPGEGASGGQETGDGEDSPLTRPFRGLFGFGDSGRTGADISGSLYGAYDENLGATLPGRAADPRYQKSGWYAGGNSRFNFNWRGERASFNGWGGASANYYPEARNDVFNRDPLVPTYTGGVGFQRPLGRRNTVNASFTAGYSPYYLNGFFADVPSLDPLPAPPVEVDPGVNVSGGTLARYSTAVGLTRELSRKSSFSLNYGYNFTDYADTSRRQTQQHGGAQFRRQLTQHATLRLGYSYRDATSELTDALIGDTATHREMHNVDAGVDYNRSFTLTSSRRTTVSFSTGSAFFTGRSLAEDGFSEQSRTRFFVTGNVSLVHEMGRTWRLAAVYSRSAGFSDLVFEPLTSDSVSASLSGLIGRRNEVSVRGSTSSGTVGSGRPDSDFQSYNAQAQWRRAITRFLAAQVSYLYYVHDFAQSVALPLGFPHATNRHGVRAGVTVWFPLH
jgi:hypothetical protein